MKKDLLVKYFLVFFLFCFTDRLWTTQAEETGLEMETKVILTNIMDRMRWMEADIECKDQRINTLEVNIETITATMKSKDKRISSLETKDKRFDILEVEMETKDQRIVALENKMKIKEEELKSLRRRITEFEETDLQLKEMVDQVRNPPSAFQCAWQDYWDAYHSNITYDRLIFDDISGGSIYNVTGGMDISTGVFRVGFSGIWTVTFSIKSYSKGGSSNDVYLNLNGERIRESDYWTYNYNPESVATLGGRTLHMRLAEGDEVSLETTAVDELYQITLCFQLAQLD